MPANLDFIGGKLLTMYGKFFASTFNGSMMASGAEVFAVWGYVIANTRDSIIELNPKLLAAVIGSTPQRMEDAVATLCAPDPMSRSPAAAGSRLVKQGAFQYHVTNHAAYKVIRNEEERREYNRIKQRESRARHVKPHVIDSQSLSSVSAHTEAEAEAENPPLPPRKRGDVHGFPPGFDRFWSAYPKKAAKVKAVHAFAKLRPDDALIGLMLAAIGQQARGEAWRKDGGQFIPMPATWINQRRWEDEAPEAPARDSLFAGAR